MISAFDEKKIISILGCGWYGLALAKQLLKNNQPVKGSTTSPGKIAALSAEGIEPYLVNFTKDEQSYDPGFFYCDVLVISIPPKTKSGGGPDHVPKLTRIIEAIKLHKIKNVVLISSTGVYADLDKKVNENTDPQPNTEAGKILLAAENLFRAEPSFKTTIIRFAGLIGPGRDPGKFFAGKKDIPNGDAPVNLIHLDDCVAIGSAVIHKQAFGYLLNACAPHHPTRAEFYTQAAIKSGLEVPVFISELKEWKIIESVYLNEVLDYKFEVARLM
ncbi:Nucleoside-diphosphate-sugar epimerase [Mucilaginibacter pineti]|uniref:Nucleoside-diphosphate-sugar epimerase n=1 Tax=Mucilaginibacter pineti TaxID=1391627 RepID=A0A1G7KUJ4_9SPHI|nr:SDR family oxidoreductase [Mucilaginibacter pineti]SDF40409.1 Nucleoside-diphosphate-sugar epimerase [Mucilaginibacter pineti]